mmetsp:Transcript_5588/g.16063  ORF Transcript_5588/g.16063 Transcript_5588/m.16063 type:complete len:210 (-) Transcript_5588:173-802(-)
MSFWAKLLLSTGNLNVTSTMPSSLMDSTLPGHQAWCELLQTSTASPRTSCPSCAAPCCIATSAALIASEDTAPDRVPVSVFRRTSPRYPPGDTSGAFGSKGRWNASPTRSATATRAPQMPSPTAPGAATAPAIAAIHPLCSIAPTPAKLVIHVGMWPTPSLTHSSSEKWQQLWRSKSYCAPGHSLYSWFIKALTSWALIEVWPIGTASR